MTRIDEYSYNTGFKDGTEYSSGATSNIPAIEAQFDQAVWQVQIEAWARYYHSELRFLGFSPDDITTKSHLDDVSYVAGRIHQLEEMLVLLNSKKDSKEL